MDAVVFQIGTRRCALELDQVEQVISLGPITPVPCATAAVLGAVNVHGRVMAVLDLRGTLGDPPQEPAPPPRPGGLGLLTRAEGCQVVLRVDRVEGVIPVAELSCPELPSPVSLELDSLLRDLLERLRLPPEPDSGKVAPAGQRDGR